MQQPVVCCREVSRIYQQESVPVHALRGVDLDVQQGEFVSLAGPSGSGKSTLLNIIGGLDELSGGSVQVGGVELAGMSPANLSALRLQKIGFVFQAYNLLYYPHWKTLNLSCNCREWINSSGASELNRRSQIWVLENSVIVVLGNCRVVSNNASRSLEPSSPSRYYWSPTSPRQTWILRQPKNC